MKKRLICLLTAALLLPSHAMAVYQTDGVNFVDSNGQVKFYGGYLASHHDGRTLAQNGVDFYSWEMGPRTTIVSEEFEIPSWTPTVSDGLVAEVNSDNANSGSNSLKFSRSSVYDGNFSGMQQTMTAKSGKNYRIEFYVKAENARGNVVVSEDIKKFLPTGTYDWQKVGFTVPSGGDSRLQLDFRCYNKTDGLWIDDITVTELGGEYSIINNGGFEQEFTEGEFIVNEGVMNYVKSVLEEDEKNGISTMILLSPHYIPDWFWDNYPNACGYQEGFLQGDVLDDDYKLFIKTHVQAMADAVSGFSSLHSLVLTNEPVYNTSYYTSGKGQHFKDEFLAYLKDVYGEGTFGYVPSKLTQNWDWGNIFPVKWDDFYASSDFMSIGNNIYSNGRYWDWMEFNNKIFGDFHKFLADSVHEIDETIPVHTKLYSPVFSRSKLSYGTDFEDLNAYFDYSGFDGGMNRNSGREGYLYIRMMEDLANSVSDKPAVNSENHVIPDNDGNFSEKNVFIADADLWQGILHGRTASATWAWDNDLVSIKNKTDVQEALKTTINNANRLSAEISELQNADKSFYILYSNAALLYSETSYLSACYNAYEALWSLGQRPAFITAKQIADGKLSNDAVLVIPSTSNIEEKAVANLNGFTGKTIVIGTTPSKNEYNKSVSVSLKNAKIVTDSIDSIRAAYEENIDNVITLKDSNGNYLDMTDIRAVETTDGILINVCNNTWEEISGVSAYKDGVKMTGGVNLIDNSTVAETFTLDTFTPMLIEFSE